MFQMHHMLTAGSNGGMGVGDGFGTYASTKQVSWHVYGSRLGTLWESNVAIEHLPLIDHFPMKISIEWGFFIAMVKVRGNCLSDGLNFEHSPSSGRNVRLKKNSGTRTK